MSNSRPKVEGIAHGTIKLYPTIGLIIKCGDEVERVGGEPNGSEDPVYVFLGNGGEGRGKVKQHTCPILMHKGCVHGCGVHIQQVAENGPTPEEALLTGKYPSCQRALPAVSGCTGHDAVISVNYVERAGAGCEVRGSTLLGRGVRLLGETCHGAVVVMMGVAVPGVMVGGGECMVVIVLRKCN